MINGLRTLFKNSRAVGNESGAHKIELSIISEEADNEEIVPTLEYIEPMAGGDALLDPSRISIIVDPLDATKEFTEERDADGTDMLPYVTTLICIVRDATPIGGIVGRPFVESDQQERDLKEHLDLLDLREQQALLDAELATQLEKHPLPTEFGIWTLPNGAES